MLEGVTIISKGGLVLYQHEGSDIDGGNNNNNVSTSSSNSEAIINNWLQTIYLNPTKSNTQGLNDKNRVLLEAPFNKYMEWSETSDMIAVAWYPKVVVLDWISNLLQATLQEYQLFAQNVDNNEQKQGDENNQNENDSNNNNDNDTTTLLLFDKTFQILLQQHQKKKSSGSRNNSSGMMIASNKQSSKSGVNNAKKEKRHWHDGKAKVTKEAMKELDFSKDSPADGDEVNQDQLDERALVEARAAYLPTQQDLQAQQKQQTQETKLDDNDNSSWGNSISGLLSQLSGNKVLQASDLETPLKDLHQQLTSKNVASDIASQICNQVQKSLIGKRLNSMYRVKTAVRQALETTINKILQPSMDLNILRQVIAKRSGGGGGISSFFSSSGDGGTNKKRPYVIVVVGINGVGKSTSVAKLAYYFQQNDCKPLLAACDTFRSGAVEQLSVHAKCLGVPIYSKGYSKDPANVAKLAIQQAMEEQNDVVLIDTAGRMQNNTPLMNALNKLVQETKPDLLVFVGESLVGNDGVDQVKMFHQAVRPRAIDAIVLTKFDTVSDKVGAALTMTHVTGAPIWFVGVGQKYHHLQQLSTPAIIKSLFA